MIDFSKIDYKCENQMSMEECLKVMEAYKWETGQYMNLPETEDSEGGKREDEKKHMSRD